MDGGEVVVADVDAHFDAQIFDSVDVPGRGVADDFAVAGMDELRALPKSLGERSEAEGGKEVFAVVNHVVRGGQFGGVAGVGAEVGVGNEGRCSGGVAL